MCFFQKSGPVRVLYPNPLLLIYIDYISCLNSHAFYFHHPYVCTYIRLQLLFDYLPEYDGYVYIEPSVVRIVDFINVLKLKTRSRKMSVVPPIYICIKRVLMPYFLIILKQISCFVLLHSSLLAYSLLFITITITPLKYC